MKKLLSIFLAVFLFCCSIPCAYADSNSSSPNAGNTQNEEQAEPRVEETDWFFRYNKELDRNEKRLWSYTYGVWLTDWIPC